MVWCGVVWCACVCVRVSECWGWYGSFQCQPPCISKGENMSFLAAPSVAACVFICSVSLMLQSVSAVRPGLNMMAGELAPPVVNTHILTG